MLTAAAVGVLVVAGAGWASLYGVNRAGNRSGWRQDPEVDPGRSRSYELLRRWAICITLMGAVLLLL